MTGIYGSTIHNPRRRCRMFHPGETICHRFYIPEIENIKKIVVTYQQNHRFVLEKVITAVSTEGDEKYIDVLLDQFDSLKFQDWKDAWAQLNVICENDGVEHRAVSNPIEIATGVQFCRKTIGNCEKPSTLDDYFILSDED